MDNEQLITGVGALTFGGHLLPGSCFQDRLIKFSADSNFQHILVHVQKFFQGATTFEEAFFFLGPQLSRLYGIYILVKCWLCFKIN